MPATGTPGVVADRLNPTAAQLGNATRPPAAGGNVDPRRQDAPPAEPTVVLSAGRAWRLGQLPVGAQPFLVSPLLQYGTSPEVSGWTMAGNPAGAPGNQIQPEHGPAMIPTGRFAWWPFKSKRDSRGVVKEKVLPVGGKDLAATADPSYAAIGAENNFILPDVRRIAPGANPRPADGRAGHPMTPTQLEPSPYHIRSEAADVDAVNMEDVTVRPRAGAADPRQARPAHVSRWLYQRPFDAWAAEHSPGLKGVLGQPRVSLPITTRMETANADTAGYRVSTPAPGMEPLGLSPNTWRQTPQPWDQDLINTGVSPMPMVSAAQGIAASSRQAARGWALR